MADRTNPVDGVLRRSGLKASAIAVGALGIITLATSDEGSDENTSTSSNSEDVEADCGLRPYLFSSPDENLEGVDHTRTQMGLATQSISRRAIVRCGGSRRFLILRSEPTPGQEGEKP